MKNLNLIRKLAWQFTKKTNLEYQELFSEASLAYCEAVREYNPDRGTKLITFAYWKMKNHLINICKHSNYYFDPRKNRVVTKSNAIVRTVDEWPESLHPTTDPEPVDVYEVVEQWPEDARHVAEMVLGNLEKYVAATPNYRRNHVGPKRRQRIVERDLEREGWEESRINQAIETVQSQLQLL